MDSTGHTSESPWLRSIERRLNRIAELEQPDERRRALAEPPEPLDRSTVQRLFDEVGQQALADARHASAAADLARRLAELLDDGFSRAVAHKATAFLLHLDCQYPQALDRFRAAAELFAAEGAELDHAATLSSSIQTLIYLGRYDEARAAAATAREVFQRRGEGLRLARLDTNEGNLLFRQERFAEAQELYRASLLGYRQHDAPPHDLAAGLHNIITCTIALGDYEGSLEAFEELLRHCERHGLGRVAAQAEYNIAYLHFLRGEYDRALDLYREARLLAEQVGDRYHESLCDLDRSEILLELNMREEAAHLAGAALAAFEELGLGYEAAKAVAFEAVAASQEGRSVRALELLDRSRERFLDQGNEAWVAILDLCRAVIYDDEGRSIEARKLALASLAFFESSLQTGKALLCELLLARTTLRAGDLVEARDRAQAALVRARELDVPALGFRAYLVAGQVAEAGGDTAGALRAYRAAADLLTDPRSHLRREVLPIPFLREKQDVYRSLVRLILADSPTAADKEEAFLTIEWAKSRSLADLLSYRIDALPAEAASHSGLVEQMRKLRKELNWYYRQIDLQEVRRPAADASSARAPRPSAGTAAPAGRLADLQARSRRHEERLIAALADLRAADSEFGALQAASILDLEAIRTSLPPDAMILEYFEAGDVVYGCCLSASTLEVRPLTTTTLVREQHQRLAFQLAKFRLGGDYAESHADELLAATNVHLRALYQELIVPLRDRMTAEHLVIVPHGGMHYLPFHALLGDGGHLIDEFTVSYAPSANVYARCAAKGPAGGEGSLVLGVPTAEAPGIRDEVDAVAAMLPGTSLHLGEQATHERLRRDGAGARIVHIAAHGLFRRDSPMFSAIQLGDSRLTLFDLYRLRLNAQLVVLSGCGTALGSVDGGDELVGLGRGLLYAGARSALISLWKVRDGSTTDLMRHFYGALSADAPPANALREAMRSLRATRPHPYFWAPWVLVGQFASPAPASAGR